jgi:hypothetical protein
MKETAYFSAEGYNVIVNSGKLVGTTEYLDTIHEVPHKQML